MSTIFLWFNLLLVSCMKQPNSKGEFDKLQLSELSGSISHDILVYAIGFLPRPLDSESNADPVEIDLSILPTPNLYGTSTTHTDHRFLWYGGHFVYLHNDRRHTAIMESMLQDIPTTISQLDRPSNETSLTRENSDNNSRERGRQSQNATTCNDRLTDSEYAKKHLSIRENLKHGNPAYSPTEVEESTIVYQDGPTTNMEMQTIPQSDSQNSTEVNPDEPISVLSPTLTEATQLPPSGDESLLSDFLDAMFDSSMVSEEARLETYAHWPHAFLSAVHMAKSGFYFTNRGDVVRCFCCGTRIEDWQQGDDPVEEHRRISTSCSYLNQLLHAQETSCPSELQAVAAETPVTSPTSNSINFGQARSASITKGKTLISRHGAAKRKVKRSKPYSSNPASTTDVRQSASMSRTDRVELILESREAEMVLGDGYSRAHVAEAIHLLIEGNNEFDVTYELLIGTLMSMGIGPSRRRAPVRNGDDCVEDNINL